VRGEGDKCAKKLIHTRKTRQLSAWTMGPTMRNKLNYRPIIIKVSPLKCLGRLGVPYEGTRKFTLFSSVKIIHSKEKVCPIDMAFSKFSYGNCDQMVKILFFSVIIYTPSTISWLPSVTLTAAMIWVVRIGQIPELKITVHMNLFASSTGKLMLHYGRAP
jgi:hypothetical protein